jgi:hypothetical protein
LGHHMFSAVLFGITIVSFIWTVLGSIAYL